MRSIVSLVGSTILAIREESSEERREGRSGGVRGKKWWRERKGESEGERGLGDIEGRSEERTCGKEREGEWGERRNPHSITKERKSKLNMDKPENSFKHFSDTSFHIVYLL